MQERKEQSKERKKIGRKEVIIKKINECDYEGLFFLTPTVALNYQTEGRMMQLNRAKFMVNGGSGYVLKPGAMSKGAHVHLISRTVKPPCAATVLLP